SLRLDQLLVDQFLIGLENGQRIDPRLGRDIAHGRQRIAFFEYAVEYHGDDAIAKLAINWLTVFPLIIHSVFDHCASYSAIVNYNTDSQASFFCFSLPPVKRASNKGSTRERQRSAAFVPRSRDYGEPRRTDVRSQLR